MSDDVRPDANQPELDGPENDAAAAEEAIAAAASDTFEQASDEEPESIAEETDAGDVNDPETNEEAGFVAEPELPGKLERLQKILAQAGVSSRRHAENLITEGRVQVNGKVVTELGTKADAARDHIRVDGKLLQGSERLRYYMLNKPRGFVTTVSDPEKRPTVMQFFAKLRERLYPVGRLDYLSEGLLLVTNDGDLANKLTRAAAGVEKTYLVKVSGEPTEEELDRLRSGVGIERGKPGSGKVQTAPAQIRKVRQGDNPWYEVVIIEGRNRELRKMFEEIGHHVEKIRRVGYGPLVLDLEPGKIRELEPEELDDLRKAADGKLRKPKSKDKRRTASQAQLPTLKPRHGPPPTAPPASDRPAGDRPAFVPRREFAPKKQFGAGRPPRPTSEGFRPRPDRPGTGPVRFGSSRPGPQRSSPQRSGPPRSGSSGSRPPQFGAPRPTWKKDDRSPRPPARFGERPPRSEQPPAQFGSAPPRQSRPTGGFAGNRRPDGARPFEKKPWKKPDSGRPDRPNRPAFKPHAGPHREAAPVREDVKPPRPSRLQIEAVEPERESPTRFTASRPPTGRPATGRPPFRGAGSGRPAAARTGQGRPSQSRPSQFRPRTDRPDRPRPDQPRPDRPRPDSPRPDQARSNRPSPDRPRFDRPRPDRPSFDRPSGARPAGGPNRTGARSFGAGRPPRAEGDRSRPFTTSTGKPRPGGARPSNKRSGPPSTGKPAWKPKKGGAGRPSSSGRSKPAFGSGSKPGGFSKSGSGYKGKAGGARKSGSGPRPGGKRPGGKPGGKKRS
jgi:23S rRNA pseudouridine2605 synthase